MDSLKSLTAQYLLTILPEECIDQLVEERKRKQEFVYAISCLTFNCEDNRLFKNKDDATKYLIGNNNSHWRQPVVIQIPIIGSLREKMYLFHTNGVPLVIESEDLVKEFIKTRNSHKYIIPDDITPENCLVDIL